MHPVVKCILGSNNEHVSQLQEVINVEGHILAQPSQKIVPSDLDKFHVYFLPDDLVQLLSSR